MWGGGGSGHNPKFQVLQSENTMTSINISTYNIAAIYNQSIVSINVIVLLVPTVICREVLFPFQCWNRFSDLKLSLLPLRTHFS